VNYFLVTENESGEKLLNMKCSNYDDALHEYDVCLGVGYKAIHIMATCEDVLFLRDAKSIKILKSTDKEYNFEISIDELISI